MAVCYGELDLSPDEVNALTMAEFTYMIIGYRRREDNQISMYRNIMWGLYTYTGFGKRPKKKVVDFGKLHREQKKEKKHIKTQGQALALAKSFNHDGT